MRPQALLPLFAALTPSLALAQSKIYQLDSATVKETFTPSIQATGDIDDDGRADFMVTGRSPLDTLSLVSGGTGTLRQKVVGGRERAVLLVDLDGDGILEYVGSTSFYSAGTVTVRKKSATGTVKYSLTPPTGSRSFGVHVAVIGDIDKDGTLDLAVSAPTDRVMIDNRMIVGVGKVFRFSGATGKPLGVCAPTELALDFGTTVTGVSDVNNDGVADLAIGSRGRAFLFSGANGKRIRVLGSTSMAAGFGTVVANVGDVDNDRVSDVAVGAPLGAGAEQLGWVSVFSGRTGSELLRLQGAKADLFGTSVSGGADLNGDRIPDVVVGAPQRPAYWRSSFEGHGYVRAFSGKDGSEIFTVKGSRAGEGFGACVGVVGDVNGDGTADIVTVRQNLVGANFTTPFAQVISGRPLMLTTDSHLMSLAAGGQQAFSIDAGKGHGGDPYFVLGSLSAAPGFVVNDVRVPLMPDVWFYNSAALANTAVFANTFGTLDAEGHAKAALRLPKLQIPGFETLTLHHAALILQNGTLRAASAAAPLTLSR